jgi:hypothetical protein
MVVAFIKFSFLFSKPALLLPFEQHIGHFDQALDFFIKKHVIVPVGRITVYNPIHLDHPFR